MILALTEKVLTQREFELLKIVRDDLERIRQLGPDGENYFQWFAHNAQQRCASQKSVPVPLDIFEDRLQGYEDLGPVLAELIHGLTFNIGGDEAILKSLNESVY